MIGFSFIYPLEKKQKIELEINLYNQQIELLNEEIMTLSSQVENLKIQTKKTFEDLNALNQEKNEKIANGKIKIIKDNYNKLFYETKEKENDIITKNIVLKYEKSKILLLKNHVNSFTFFRWLFLILGSVFSIFGLWNWNKSTKIAEKIQKFDLKKKERELEA